MQTEGRRGNMTGRYFGKDLTNLEDPIGTTSTLFKPSQAKISRPGSKTISDRSKLPVYSKMEAELIPYPSQPPTLGSYQAPPASHWAPSQGTPLLTHNHHHHQWEQNESPRKTIQNELDDNSRKVEYGKVDAHSLHHQSKLFPTQSLAPVQSSLFGVNNDFLSKPSRQVQNRHTPVGRDFQDFNNLPLTKIWPFLVETKKVNSSQSDLQQLLDSLSPASS